MTLSENQMRPLAAVIAFVLLLGLSGCVSSQEPVESTVTIGEVDRMIWSSTEELTVQCMAHEGFDYLPRSYEATTKFAGISTPFDLKLEDVKLSGFGYIDGTIADFSAGGGSSGSDTADDPDLDAAAQAAFEEALLGGSQSEGCRSVAQQESFEQHKDELTNSSLRVLDPNVIAQDQRYVAIVSTWLDCMGEAGFQVGSIEDLQRQYAVQAASIVSFEVQPDQSVNKVLDEEKAAEFRDQEIAAATATVECLEPHREAFKEIVADARE